MMEPFSIIIPYRYAEDRESNFQFVQEYYQTNYPMAEIVIGYDDTGKDDFNRGHAINKGVGEASYDNLLISDGDIFIDPPTLKRGFELLEKCPFVIPWGRCLDPTRERSEMILRNGFRGKVRKLKKHSYMVRDIRPGRAFQVEHDGRVIKFDKCAGGLHIVRKDFFNQINGYDSRLSSWGFEDTLFCFKARNVLGDYPILEDGFVCHLWHDRSGITVDVAMRNKSLFFDIVMNELENIKLP